MFDFFTYFIYLSLLFFVLFLTYKGARFKSVRKDDIELTQTSNLSYYHLIALLAISIIVGFRFGVGVDWQGYKDIFEDINLNIPTYKVELGYYFINKGVSIVGGTSEVMFLIISLISWYFIFKSVPNLILPLLLFFLFSDEIFFWSMNGVRQFIALSIFLYAIQFIINKKLLIYLSLIILATLFHTTAILLIPFYFIPYGKLYNQKVWFVIFLISALLANTSFFVNGIQQMFTQVALKIGLLSAYLGYFDRGQYAAEKIVIGFGFIFKLLINLFILIFSKEVINRNPQLKVYFILFFTGTIIFNLFFMYQPIGRINIYFLIMRCVVLSLIIHHLWTIRKHIIYKILSALIIFLYFIIFLSAIYNSSNLCSPYNFSF